MLNYAGVSALTPGELSARASRVLRFIDLGGHERYLKTALYGAPLLWPIMGPSRFQHFRRKNIAPQCHLFWRKS